MLDCQLPGNVGVKRWQPSPLETTTCGVFWSPLAASDAVLSSIAKLLVIAAHSVGLYGCLELFNMLVLSDKLDII